MMVSERNKSPDFFEDHTIDPMAAAAGTIDKRAVRKKKAGFYLSEDLLERFNRRFHLMKIEGIPIVNKSALLELAIRFALDDLDRADESLLLSAINEGESS
ncbi:MAG: hypothetical protein HKM93_09865 [Desulfobacteraceae bacterium]|nr:hypothetical protein [Desulfobacteraceae bacterium]